MAGADFAAQARRAAWGAADIEVVAKRVFEIADKATHVLRGILLGDGWVSRAELRFVPCLGSFGQVLRLRQ